MAVLDESVLLELDALVDVKEPVLTGLSNAAAWIYHTMSDLNWAGFYQVLGNDLLLGPFQGKPACTVLHRGKGVCGTAWELDQVIRVEDVHAFPGHIACDAASASEIVLPLHAGGRVVAVLDLDSPVPGRFSAEDEAWLVRAAELIESKLYGFQDRARLHRAQAPIGVLDSGVGGISVLRAMTGLMPAEDYIYYGDSLNAPYGTKTAEEVQRLTFHAASELMGYGVKALVVACNTATSAAIMRLRERYPDMPVIGVEPALKPAAKAAPGGRVMVMATPMTLSEHKFRELTAAYCNQVRILPVTCEGLMEFVERGELDSPELDAYLRDKLGPHLPVDAVVLGCTHYPFVADAIRKAVGSKASIWEGGPGAARELQRRLQQAGLLREPGRSGEVTFLNSLQNEAVLELSRRLLYGN
ncbi:MAG: glutamate racemase [Firmicutes bacterium]|nr:glutamate racemase [Bacillota bacterium]